MHEAFGQVVGHMIALQAVVCSISSRRMLEVLTHIYSPMAPSYSGGHCVNRSSKSVGTLGDFRAHGVGLGTKNCPARDSFSKVDTY